MSNGYGEIKTFNDLDAWKKAYDFVISIYKVTKEFPREEYFGIISQMRRASSSITANIAEGFARYHFKDKIRFYYQARGSIAEVQNFILVSRGLNYINNKYQEQLFEEAEQIRQLINGLIRSIQRQY